MHGFNGLADRLKSCPHTRTHSPHPSCQELMGSKPRDKIPLASSTSPRCRVMPRLLANGHLREHGIRVHSPAPAVGCPVDVWPALFDSQCDAACSVFPAHCAADRGPLRRSCCVDTNITMCYITKSVPCCQLDHGWHLGLLASPSPWAHGERACRLGSQHEKHQQK